MFQRAFDRPLGHGQVERLGQVVEGPVPHGGDGGGEFAVGGHHDDRHARRGLLEMLHRRQAVHARQADIEHDHIRPRVAGRGEALFGRDGGRGRMAQLLGQLGQTPADALFVVDDEEVGHGGRFQEALAIVLRRGDCSNASRIARISAFRDIEEVDTLMGRRS